MNQFLSLIKREFWEWRFLCLRLPVFLCAAATCLMLIAIVTSNGKIQYSFSRIDHHSAAHIEQSSGADLHIAQDTATEADITQEKRAARAWIGDTKSLVRGLALVYAMFIAVLLIVLPTYLLGTLHNDRRDRSILFWKSLPVAEYKIVLAKLCVATLATPAMYSAAAVTSGVVLMFASVIGSLVSGYPLPLPMELVQALLYSLPGLIVSWVLLALWVLPVICWLLLCSAWAKKMNFLLALGIPLGAVVLEYWVLSSFYFGKALRHQLSAGFATFAQILPHPENVGAALAQSLSAPAFWLGLLLSAFFLQATIWLRENRFEI